MQLTRSWLFGDKNLSPRTGEHHLLHSLVFPFTLTVQDLYSHIYRVTEQTFCMWRLNLPIDISVTFVPLHYVRKGTRLSPFLLFVVVMWGESLGKRLVQQREPHSQDPCCASFPSFSLCGRGGRVCSLIPRTLAVPHSQDPCCASFPGSLLCGRGGHLYVHVASFPGSLLCDEHRQYQSRTQAHAWRQKGLVMLCTFFRMCWVSVLCEWSTFLTGYIQICAAGSCWRWLIISGNSLPSSDQGQELGDPSSSLSRGYSLSCVKEFNYCRVIDNSWTWFVYLKLNLLTQHMQ